MNITVYPSEISGILTAPSSKSLAIRAIVAAMLADGTSILKNPSRCDDALAAIKMAEYFGADFWIEDDILTIIGGAASHETLINCGESGLLARLMIPLAALGSDENTITGEGTLLKRHPGNITEPLQNLGVKCSSNNDFLPVKVKGPLCGGKVEVDGSESSQFISGLLMALPLATSDSVVIVHDLKSRPYIDLTLDLLKKFNIRIENRDYNSFKIPGNQKYKAAEIELEGDWSGAAFLLVAAAINGEVRVKGLNRFSEQADRNILKALAAAGVRLNQNDDEISVSKSPLSAFEFDATHCPDLFPPLAVLAAACVGVSKIKGVERLSNKESNRGLTLQEELGKLGIEIILDGDTMLVKGGSIKGGSIFSHHDHRIAMAAAVAGLIAEKPVIIQNAECVSKSWPSFFEDLKTLNVDVLKSEM
jgi:3-phosphoshikimate 1-carboxyvinyltransferase